MKTDFELCETCDVHITLMTSCVGDVSEKLHKNVLSAFTVLSINRVISKHFSLNSWTTLHDSNRTITRN